MGIIRKLASQTAVYGLSSMLGRFINFLLVIPHTEYLKSVGDYGDITTIFAFMAFFNILLTYGMETTYFKFIRSGHTREQIFTNAQLSLLFSSFLFVLISIPAANKFAGFMGFPGRLDYVYCCLAFLFFDSICVLPFASLRHEEKPLHFAAFKLLNIGVNVSLNLYFLISPPPVLSGFSQVTLILLANAIASFVTFLALSRRVFRISLHFDAVLYRKMLKYAWPLIFVGFAGIVNETLDRTLLKRMLPSDEGSYQNGIYGSFYKLTMIMTMFVQAFRFAAEPLFFKQEESRESRVTYARVMYWFTAVCSLIFLICMLYIDELAHLFIRKKQYFEDERAFTIVPLLLLANLFLGIYYNLSIWYRFTDKTGLGAVVAGGGALLTIILNVIFIPRYGFVACAWITMLVYLFMCIASYLLGKKYYHVPYPVSRILFLILSAGLLWFITERLSGQSAPVWLCTALPFLATGCLLLIIRLLQPKEKID